MLPEVTEHKRMDTLSTLGYAFGYIGSVIPFVACLVLMADSFGLNISLFGLTLQHENIAVGALVILFIIGFILFCKADKLCREKVRS